MTFGRNIQNTIGYTLYASVFVYVCFFINFMSFKPGIKNANFDAVSSKRANFDQVQFFKTYT